MANTAAWILGAVVAALATFGLWSAASAMPTLLAIGHEPMVTMVALGSAVPTLMAMVLLMVVSVK